MIRVVVVKDGKEVGWFKDLEPGINCIIESCKNNSLEVEKYELRHYENRNILWSGKKYTENIYK